MTEARGTVLITGAGQRIGASLARTLAKDGWRVGVHYRNSRSKAEALAAELRAAGGSAVALPANLVELDQVVALIDQCEARLGPPNCLINNASEFLEDTVRNLTEERWDAHMLANLRAPVFLSRKMAERLPQGASGNIINMIDQRVWKPTPEFFSYTLSKAALWSATRMLAQALAPRIRVNAIAPGPVLPSIHQTAGEFEQEWRATLLGEPAAVSDIVAGVRFILDAPTMTGQMIAIDSGQHLAWS